MVQNKLSRATGPRPSAQPIGVDLCRRQDCSLIAEADHRVANHLALLAGHVRLRAATLARQSDAPRSAAIGVLLGIEAEIAAVGRLHRQLSSAAHGPLDLALELHEICAPFRFGLSGEIVLIEDFEPGCEATTNQVLPLARIVTEVITNALKYAYPDGRSGSVIARLHKANPETAVIEIADHGPGFPPSFDLAAGGALGFRVVRALAQQLRATATFSSSGEGVHFKLSLPLAPG